MKQTFLEFIRSESGKKIIEKIKTYKKHVGVLKGIQCDIRDVEKLTHLNIIQKQNRRENLISKYDNKRHDPKFIQTLNEFKKAKKTLSDYILENKDISHEEFKSLLRYDMTYEAEGAYGRLLKIINKIEEMQVAA